MKWKNNLLGVLELFVAFGALPAGIAMIMDPSGVGVGMSSDILDGSPFASFLIPGIFLTVVHGLGSLLGGIWSFRRHRYAGRVGILLGIVLIAWLAIQIYYIGLLHFLQWLFFLIGLLEIILGLWINRSKVIQQT